MKKKIINLTQHPGSEEQKQEGLVDLPENELEGLKTLLTFESLPSQEEIQKRAISIAEIASNHSVQYAMIGGAPYLMAPLERELKKRGITPLYAFSLRESAEKVEADGSTTKMVVFRHKGFVEVS